MLPAVREGHELAAMFVFPSLQHEYRAKAEDYISHFVGHEGAGSLLNVHEPCFIAALPTTVLPCRQEDMLRFFVCSSHVILFRLQVSGFADCTSCHAVGFQAARAFDQQHGHFGRTSITREMHL